MFSTGWFGQHGAHLEEGLPMDEVGAIAANSTDMATQSVQAQVITSMLKKYMDTEEAVVAQILQSLPPPPNPPGQGAIVNSYA
jgi:hypothetical protein